MSAEWCSAAVLSSTNPARPPRCRWARRRRWSCEHCVCHCSSALLSRVRGQLDRAPLGVGGSPDWPRSCRTAACWRRRTSKAFPTEESKASSSASVSCQLVEVKPRLHEGRDFRTDLPKPQDKPLKLHIKLSHRLVGPYLASLEQLRHHLGDLGDLQISMNLAWIQSRKWLTPCSPARMSSQAPRCRPRLAPEGRSTRPDPFVAATTW